MRTTVTTRQISRVSAEPSRMPYGAGDDKYFTTRLTLSPAGDELTLDFAKTLLENEQLGQDEIPDYLAISFSSTDYVGHIFGASSLESEDNIARLDRTLADLFAFVDQKVGLDEHADRAVRRSRPAGGARASA